MPSQVAFPVPTFLHQINQIVTSDNCDPLIITQLKNEIQNNELSSDIDSYVALGTLASLEGNFETLQEN